MTSVPPAAARHALAFALSGLLLAVGAVLVVLAGPAPFSLAVPTLLAVGYSLFLEWHASEMKERSQSMPGRDTA